VLNLTICHSEPKAKNLSF